MITKTTVLSRARTALGDAAKVTFSDADLDTFFEEAVERYSALSPVMAKGSLTTVTDQTDYTAPTGIVELGRVLKWTGVEIEALEEFFSGEDLRGYQDTLPPPFLSLVWDATVSAYKVRVQPKPRSNGRVIEFEYTKAHTADGSGNYPSAPTKHQTVLVKLVQAAMEDALATELDKRGTVREGDSTLNNERGATNLRSHAEALRQEAVQMLDEPVLMRG